MKQLQVTKAEQGQRLNKYLARILKSAPQSFLYKMMRKKNITLNGARAEGSEILKSGDVVCFFLSDETFAKFAGEAQEREELFFCETALKKEAIRYEDAQILIAYKPAGLLSQRDKSEEASINEKILQYLADGGELTPDMLRTFRPSVCNRLDRNTGGLILFAKTLGAQQQISRALHDRTIEKYYLCIVHGTVTAPFVHKGYLQKDAAKNRVVIGQENKAGDKKIQTEGWPLAANGELTLMRIKLDTGKPHQIRAVMQALGHPILGDPKYAGLPDGEKNFRAASKRLRISSQMLLSYEIVMPKFAGNLSHLSGRQFFSPLCGDFGRVLKEEFPEAASLMQQGGSR